MSAPAAASPAAGLRPAPAWQVSRWFGAAAPPSLAALRGRVVALEVFQMLCPGCVSHALPQAQRLHALFPPSQLAVIGLHSVFEHHAVMGPEALGAFVHEYRLPFPVGIDAAGPAGDPVPLTMRAYGLQGTPSLVLIDRDGMIRLQHFGRLDDLQLGALIGRLLGAAAGDARAGAAADPVEAGCTAGGCGLSEPR